MSSEKPFHSLVVDTGPLIKNTISISTILQTAENVYSTPAILSEIKDAATRSRVETTLLPFLKLRSPTPASYDVVAKFSKKTGDFAVLSRQDLGILALAYELDQEWKKQESQKVSNESIGNNQEGQEVSAVAVEAEAEAETIHHSVPEDQSPKDLAGDEYNLLDEAPAHDAERSTVDQSGTLPQAAPDESSVQATSAMDPSASTPSAKLDVGEDNGIRIHAQEAQPLVTEEESSGAVVEPTSDPTSKEAPLQSSNAETLEALHPTSSDSNSNSLEQRISELQVSPPDPIDGDDDDDDDEGEWITPSNVKNHQAKDSGVSLKLTQLAPASVATMTTDYAMQNVLLQMQLALISPSMQRIRNIRTSILRCHACFLTTKEMDKQFCPRCGQPTLNRVSCSTNAKGEFRIHLAKNFQWNNRGNRYSVPKPVAGTTNGKNIKGGGQRGWGNDLILAEDQKEHIKHIDQEKRKKTRDLMDEDYLPNILTGDRKGTGGRAKVGAGRNVNSKKRN